MASLNSEAYGIQSEAITDYKLLKRGDHIAVEGRLRGEKYYHHGIYLGSGYVADFGGDGKTDAKPSKGTIDEWTIHKSRKLVRINYINGQCLPNDKAAKNAEAFVNNPNCWSEFNIIRNNCEHFATRCKTGRAMSTQVRDKVIECIQNPAKLIYYVFVMSDAGLNSAPGYSSY